MDRSIQSNQRVESLVRATDPVKIQEAYRDWAPTYNEDLENFGYLGPKIGAMRFMEAFPQRDSLILDAGCGTGLVGRELAELGYEHLHGVDFSPEMLATAKLSGHYARLMEASFLRPAFLEGLAIADETYDAAICIGVYQSPMKETLIPELIRVIKPSGVLCLSARLHYVEDELDAQLKSHAEAGLFKIESVTQRAYMQSQNADAFYFVLRK